MYLLEEDDSATSTHTLTHPLHQNMTRNKISPTKKKTDRKMVKKKRRALIVTVGFFFCSLTVAQSLSVYNGHLRSPSRIEDGFALSDVSSSRHRAVQKNKLRIISLADSGIMSSTLLKSRTSCAQNNWALRSAFNGDFVLAGGGADKHRYSLSANTINSVKSSVCNHLAKNNYESAMKEIEAMINLAQESSPTTARSDCEVVDELIHSFTSMAFSHPHTGEDAKKRILMGMRMLHLQLSSTMVFPYNKVPKRTFLNAMRALTDMEDCQYNIHKKAVDSNLRVTDAAFRILQRLITGYGVRHRSSHWNSQIGERDFNMVLNAYSNVGRMDMAHRVVALQERTKNAPPLSPVAYSILLKGYGRQGDLANVKMILRHAKMNHIVPDTIMLNSLIDAYINCNAIERGLEVFSFMKTFRRQDKVELLESDNLQLLFSETTPCPIPNRRTYNTVLKGLANKGDLEKALSLGSEMEGRGLWDDVTTNTLVHAAVVSHNFTVAENILHRYTKDTERGRRINYASRRHPNVEAYTQLLDAYAKTNNIAKAVKFFKFMKDRGVEPNEVTYTCLIAAFARRGNVYQAWKFIEYMVSNDLQPTSITYNAFISGLVNNNSTSLAASQGFDKRVDEALKVVREMLRSGIRPNAVTISLVIDALGRCQPSRVEEAKALVAKLERNGVIIQDNQKVVTALVQACGYDGDLSGALDAFRKLKAPDVVAVNAFLDAACRCGREKVAMETFEYYYLPRLVTGTSRMEPDVITYSVLISALLKKNTNASNSIAQKLYKEMKKKRKIQPDKTLVDIILKAIIRTGRLHHDQVSLASSVLRDAETLVWGEGQLERRKRAVRSVMDGWRNQDLRSLLPASTEDLSTEDKLFKRKGWNKVDSGFRLWGGGTLELMKNAQVEEENERVRLQRQQSSLNRKGEVIDNLLESKGWNDVDSRFRIF